MIDRNTILGPALLAVEQRIGFLGVEVYPADPVITAETTTSTTYVNLTTTGPSLSNLPDGTYWILFGSGGANNTGGVGSRMSISVNGAAAADNDGILVTGTETAASSRGVKAVLGAAAGGGVNSIVAKYRVGAASTGTWQFRWLVAFRYANV